MCRVWGRWMVYVGQTMKPMGNVIEYTGAQGIHLLIIIVDIGLLMIFDM